MIRSLIAFGCALLLAVEPPGMAVQEPPKPPAGWPDLFVNLGMYDLKIDAPVLGKGDPPEAYSQKATYLWTGGRYEAIVVTLARDPAFKDRFSAEAMKKEKTPPVAVQVAGKPAWKWEFKDDPDKFDRLAGRLVVLLAPDKVLVVEQRGFGLALEDVAKKFDLARVEKALAAPPAN